MTRRSILITLLAVFGAACRADSTPPSTASACDAPIVASPSCAGISEQLAKAAIFSFSPAGDDWGKTLDGTSFGTTIALDLIITPSRDLDVEIVVSGNCQAVRIPIGRSTDVMPVKGTLFVDLPPPRAYDEYLDAFPDAPRFTGSDVLLSYRTSKNWDEAWLVTREGDALVVWIATGPYEDVPTDATWGRYVLVQLTKGATVAT